MKLRILTLAYELILPEYFIITFFSVFAAGLIIGRVNGTLILPALILSTIMIGLNVLNNIYDVAIDRINKPQRPLVTGKLSQDAAYLISFGSFGFALLLAAIVNAETLMVTMAATLLAIVYSVPPLKLKNFVMGPNIIGGIIYGILPFIITSLVLGVLIKWPFAMLFFGLIFSMAPIKDIEDLQGETILNVKSIAVRFGKKKTILISMGGMIVTNLIMTLFVIFGAIAKQLFFSAILSIGIVLILTYILIRAAEEKQRIVTQSKLVTYTMSVVVLIELIYGLFNTPIVTL